MLQKLVSCLVFLIGSAVVPLCMQIENEYNLIPDTCFQPLVYHNWIVVLGFTVKLVTDWIDVPLSKSKAAIFIFCHLICWEASAL